ncbi:MAG TPA: serine hydrolase [Roseiflexaceae bacterium]|nr:serine hydrolase [Roseiflexaceae bacterium]
MKPVTASSTPRVSRSPTPLRSVWFGQTVHLILGVAGWALLMLFLLLTALGVGWILLGIVLLGSGPAADADPQPIVHALVLLAISGTLAWVVARFFASPRIVGLAVSSTLVLLLVAGGTWALTSPDRALFLARDIAWGPSDVWDEQKFPERVVTNAPPAFQFQQRLRPELFQTIEYKQAGQLKQANFAEFLTSTQTTSFVVIKDGAILYEGYFNGYNRDSIVTSFSTAKSVTSALIGIAIDEGRIGSVDDPIVSYLPELRGKGLDSVTIRHLLLMSSGISYVSDDEISGLAELSPFSDDGLSYSYPNLRSQALAALPDGKQPGTEFNYNNYNPALLGMILERTTHVPVAEYLQEKLWRPLGMEYPASWSLDSKQSGFELMGAGINGRAIDFAKFGWLFLNNGNWNGKQIISEQWVRESTSPYPNPNGSIAWRANTWFTDWKEANGYYKYLWWGKLKDDGSYDHIAWGHFGQRIYVSPQNNAVAVRFGISDEGVDSWDDVLASVIAKAKGAESDQAPVGLSEARETLRTIHRGIGTSKRLRCTAATWI